MKRTAVAPKRSCVVVLACCVLFSVSCVPQLSYSILEIRPDRLDISQEGQIPRWLLPDVGSGVEVILTGPDLEPLGPASTLIANVDGDVRTIEWSVVDCPGRALYHAFDRVDSSGVYFLEDCFHKRSADDQLFLVYQPSESYGETDTSRLQLFFAETVRFAAHGSFDRLLMEFGSLYKGLYWWSPENGEIPLRSVVKTSTGEFQLADSYDYFSNEGYAGTGNAMSPDWSPDGSSIAFLASDVTGLAGQDRIDQSWDICLLDVSTETTECILPGIYDPGRIRWSPDGGAIAFSGSLGRGGEQALWVYTLAQGALEKVYPGLYEDMAWQADGSRIYAILLGRDEALDWSLWSFDLPTDSGDSQK